MTSYDINGYTFIAPSRRKFKKYDVYKKNKYLTSFGDNRYKHYNDKIGFYSYLNHKDKDRRNLYYKRFGLSAGFETPKFFSNKFLW